MLGEPPSTFVEFEPALMESVPRLANIEPHLPQMVKLEPKLGRIRPNSARFWHSIGRLVKGAARSPDTWNFAVSAPPWPSRILLCVLCGSELGAGLGASAAPTRPCWPRAVFTSHRGWKRWGIKTLAPLRLTQAGPVSAKDRVACLGVAWTSGDVPGP